MSVVALARRAFQWGGSDRGGLALAHESPEAELERACVALERAVDDTDVQATSLSILDCERLSRFGLGSDDSRHHHALLHRIGTAALRAGELATAERFAIESLKALPRFGGAFKLLGQILNADGRPEEAALCHRYGLPHRLRERWFDLEGLERIDSRRPGSGLSRLVAWPSETVPLSAPWQHQRREVVELSDTSLTSAEAATTRLPRGRLWYDTFNSVVWDRDGRLVEDLCRGYSEVVQGSLGSREAVRVPGRVALLGNRNQKNYYHWMNDVLPRLEVLQASGHALDGIDRFLLAPLTEDFQHETLARLGIGTERLLFTRNMEYLDADELLIPIFGSNTLGTGQGAWNPAFLKRAFLDTEAPRRRDRRLYLSRGTAGARGIVNEPELLDRLAARGFERVRTESLGVVDQARLFSEAEAVFGPHGAGFSNIAFCAPGTQVIELFSAHIAPCFWTISELTGLRHAVHFCGEVDESTRPSEDEAYHRSADDRRRAPFTVDVEEIERMLDIRGLQRCG